MNKENLHSLERHEMAGQLVLRFNKVSVIKGWQAVLENVTFTVNRGEHIALVGPNGIGKTTLFRAVLGEETLSSGSVIVPNSVTLSYVPQAIENLHLQHPQLTVLDYFLHARNLDTIYNQMRIIEKKLVTSSDPLLLNTYGQLQTLYQTKGGYTIEHEAKSVMAGVGLSSKIDLQDDVGNLSGGEKTKIFVAQALLSQADLLLLDEPSNHLDPDSVGWLGNYLNNYNGSAMVISHDSAFLNTFSQKVIELSNSGATIYKGNYDNFLTKKTTADRLTNKHSKRAQREIKRLDSVIDKYKAGSRAKMAKDREKKRDRIVEEMPISREKAEEIKLHFEIARPGPLEVLSTKNVVKKYKNTVLDYTKIDLNIKRGEKNSIVWTSWSR